MHNRWHPDLEPVATDRAGRGAAPRVRGRPRGTADAREHARGRRRASTSGSAIRSQRPVYVEGAEPGDVLEVEFVSYEPADFGVTAVIPGFGFLADLFPEPYVVKWDIADGVGAVSRSCPASPCRSDAVRRRRRRRAVARAAGGDRARARTRSPGRRARRGRRCPSRPCRPRRRTGLRTIPPREIGGNLDIRQLVAGSRLLLPVSVPGRALLGRRPPLRAGRRRGLWHRRSRSPARSPSASACNATPPGGRAIRPTRRPGGRGARSFATTGIPVDDAMDLTRRGARGPARDDRLPRGDATASSARRRTRSAASAVDLRISEAVDVPYPLVSALLPLDVFD